jgi:hypothetical protein
MKKNKIVLSALITSIILTSCATTPEAAENQDSANNSKDKAPKAIVVQESPEDIFIKSLEGISVQKVSSPKEISKGRNFAAPFVFSVTKADGSPAEGFALTLEYPASKSEGSINFDKVELLTDAEGKISFTAEQPSFAVKTSVKAYPTPVSEAPSLAERLKPYTAEADWKVKSDLASKGAVLFVWDYNEKDRPVNNSYNIQAEFRGRGITMVGNGPIGETSYIGKPKSLYKDTYDIIGGTAYGYLIYGTIKFEQPVTALEDGSGYYCILKADIEAVSMKNGELIYSSSITHEESGKNWNDCVSKAKDKLSKLVVDDIIYGL